MTTSHTEPLPREVAERINEEPDRQERRMAELLVHDHVPWSAFIGVAARNDNKCRQAEHALSSVGIEIPVRPRPGWYF